ncbi:putative ATP-binding protein involved in virulence [Loktanella ponticola]|uniref:Putative ATP-binding protein involved in virulence n=1 Tax=Yoonia ponticola TaxID=1524255 RepID=A0A7W9BME7_9RHOB|nr:AAA family ATPase [Yoonia ponticola]MBB5723213.1 putative ATP-binding protein involved in virulence [Yoonia ponticola]
MEIEEISLSNFRGFRDGSFSFGDNINLIVGVNGAGKTTVLDGLATAMSWLVNRTLNDRSNGYPIDEMDIRNGARASAIEVSVKHEGERFKWKVIRSARGVSSHKHRSELSELTDLSRNFQGSLGDNPESASLPLVIYYPVDRSIVEIPLRTRGKRAFNQLSAYDDALKSAANFRRFFEWFRYKQEESLSNFMEDVVDKLRTGDALESIDDLPVNSAGRELNAVREAVYKFMPGFSDLRIMYSPLRMVVEKNDRRLNLLQLSGGEKIMLALVGDLARRLTLANPNIADPLTGEAIVLIDEIDLHLHPKWQRNAISQLATVFPNCQFILSTHSPHIITHVPPENISAVKTNDNGEVQVHSVRASYGYTAESVLGEIMGLDTTRPDEVQELFDQIFKNISDGDLDQAEKNLECLKSNVTADPEVTRAKALISRKKLLGK